VDILLPNGTATLRAVGIVKKDGPGLLNSGAVAFVPLIVAQDLFARGGDSIRLMWSRAQPLGNSTQKLAALRAVSATGWAANSW
jgi:hypothetical protein